MMVFTAQFWKQTAELAARGAAGAMILVIGADQADVFSLDWQQVVGFGLGGAVLSVLASVASAPLGKAKGPTVVSPPA